MNNPKISEDWVSVIIALLVITLILLGALPELPWPFIGLLK